MTTTKPPVLTDEELIALWDRHVGTPCDKYPLGPRDAINFGRAVLARAGADAVRDAALEEAALTAEDLRRTKWQGTNFYASAAVQIATAIRGMKRTAHQRCDLGMGCEQAGVCYAEAMGKVDECGAQSADAIRALKGTPAAAVADEGTQRPADYEWFKDWYAKDAPDESEVDIVTMARHSWLAGIRFADLFPAPQAGQLSGNAGEVDKANAAFVAEYNEWIRYHADGGGNFDDFLKMVNERAAIAASKGANHG